MNHVVITGGTGGLGTAIARAFSGDDWRVDAPGSATLDVVDPEVVFAYFTGKPVDLLVCAAGIIRDAPLARLGAAAWDEVIRVNFMGARLCANAVLPGMIARGRGHIIFISSQSALHPPVGQVAYATAKAALLGLTTDLASIHGPHNIRVNTILPGFLETRMTESVSTGRKAEVLSQHRLGRYNTPEVTAGFIRHLHDHLPHTSGQVFQLDSRL